MEMMKRYSISEIEGRVCNIASEYLLIPRSDVTPNSRLIEDLNCDSLDLIELVMKLEEAFSVALPQPEPNPVYKAIFTRQPFRLRDLAELVYLQQGTGTPLRQGRKMQIVGSTDVTSVPFSQLEGRYIPQETQGLWERLESSGNVPQLRRKTDGMRCLLLPSAEVEIGRNEPEAQQDERPAHVVKLDAFLIDAEPVSTSAYCRFLNSIEGVTAVQLSEWFILDSNDDRQAQLQIRQSKDGWKPIAGTELMPMVLVSWFGAAAYSLWAHGADWTLYGQEDGANDHFLPSEAQWEYAARGTGSQPYPFGVEYAAERLMNFSRHRTGETYRAETMPLSPVNEELGLSPFGLHHMAGNVWQWCRDWYSDSFYLRSESTERNPVNRENSGVRSERGGSWVGPAELCRSSYRRGRNPCARGRCLGFRCVNNNPAVPPL